MNLISTQEAADQKGVSRQAIIDAINRGTIDGQRLSPRNLVVIANKKFEAWQPMAVRQESGRAARAKKAPKTSSPEATPEPEALTLRPNIAPYDAGKNRKPSTKPPKK